MSYLNIFYLENIVYANFKKVSSFLKKMRGNFFLKMGVLCNALLLLLFIEMLVNLSLSLNSNYICFSFMRKMFLLLLEWFTYFNILGCNSFSYSKGFFYTVSFELLISDFSFDTLIFFVVM